MSLVLFAFAVVVLIGSIIYDLEYSSDAGLETKVLPYVEVALFLWMGIFFFWAGRRTLAGKYPR